MNMKIWCLLGAAVIGLSGPASFANPAKTPAVHSDHQNAARQKEAADLPDSLPINQIQVLGTHNSYSMGVDPHILAMLEKAVPSMAQMVAAMPEENRKAFLVAHPNDVSLGEALSYSHVSLTEQLDRGVRALELDINADPEGGAYADPAAYRLLRQQGITDLKPFDAQALKKPGLKVLHMADVDFRSSCPTFRGCLEELKAWSDANPDHVPVFIMIEAKVQSAALLPGAITPPPFTAETYNELDRTIIDVIGRSSLITPDDVRGSHATLEQAVLAGGWPTLGASRGKFLFQLITATGREGASAYLNGHPGLAGRVAFLDSEPGRDHAAFILNDNAMINGDQIRDQVRKGYFVRSRADIETWEAKVNDMARADAAFASGAQIVSTDYIKPGNAYGTSYVVTLPGGGAARQSPAVRP